MPTFGPASKKQFDTLDPRLQEILSEAIKLIDFTIVEGFRGKEAQNIAYAKGYSQKKWPDGNHNKNPSLAADVMPYPVNWSDASRNMARVGYLQGVIFTIAKQLGIPIRQGMDFNQNGNFSDDGFFDAPHMEIIL